MSHVDARMLSRWIVAGVLLLTPLAVGCGAKSETAQETAQETRTGTVPEAQPADAGLPQQATPSTEAPPEPAGTSAPGTPTPQTPADAPFSDAAVFDEIEQVKEADRPRSLFRSIGRAPQKGVTDATSASSNDTAEPEPVEPR